MFSFSGLTKEQVLRLREEFGVYAVASGRVNVAGMTPDNMAPLCEAIVAVLEIAPIKKACVMQAFFYSGYQTGISSCRNGL